MSNLYDVIKETVGDRTFVTSVLAYQYIQSLEVTVDGYYKDFQKAFSEYRDAIYKAFNAKWYIRWYYEIKLAKAKQVQQQHWHLYMEAKRKLRCIEELYMEIDKKNIEWREKYQNQ